MRKQDNMPARNKKNWILQPARAKSRLPSRISRKA